MAQSNHDESPNRVSGTALASEPRDMLSPVQTMSARQLAADKLLWQMLGQWKRSSPELVRSHSIFKNGTFL